MTRRFGTQLGLRTAPLIAVMTVLAYGSSAEPAGSTFVFSSAARPDAAAAQPLLEPQQQEAATLKIVGAPRKPAPSSGTPPANGPAAARSTIPNSRQTSEGFDKRQAPEVTEVIQVAPQHDPANETSAQSVVQDDGSDRNAPQSYPSIVVGKRQQAAIAKPFQVIAPVWIEYVQTDRASVLPVPRRLPASQPVRLAATGNDRPRAWLLPQPRVPNSASLADLEQRSKQHIPLGNSMKSKNSLELQHIIHAARQHTVYGFGLASRGAVYSAHEQFEAALMLIAQGLDARDGTSSHSKALASALTALEEANDLAPAAKSVGQASNIQHLIADHTSKLLDEAELANVTPMTALQKYYSYARQQLAEAGGNVRVAARAMYGMGRVYAYLAEHGGLNDSYSASKATILYRAALEVDPSNHQAANELGVVLARYGQWDEAQKLLEKSVRIAPRPTTARNLATVLRRRGDHQRAARAWQLHQKLAEQPQSAETPKSGDSAETPVRWVAHHEFARQSRATDDGQPVAANPPAKADRHSPAPSNSKPAKRSFFSPWTEKLFSRTSKKARHNP